MRSRRSIATAIALAAIASTVFAVGPAGADATAGAFTVPFAEDPGVAAAAPQDEATSAEFPTAVSMAVLPDGNVLYFNGLQDTENLNGPIAASIPPDQASKSRLLNLRTYFATGQLPDEDDFSVPSPEHGDGADMFCTDLRLLANGKVLVVGGTVWVNEDEDTTNGTPLEGLGRSELYGAKDARVYDPLTNT